MMAEAKNRIQFAQGIVTFWLSEIKRENNLIYNLSGRSTYRIAQTLDGCEIYLKLSSLIRIFVVPPHISLSKNEVFDTSKIDLFDSIQLSGPMN